MSWKWLFVVAAVPVLLGLALSLGLTPMAPPAVPDAPVALRVTVSLPPQAWLVERLGGARVAVTTLVEAGQDPHTYQPTPRQMAELAASRAFFSIGVPFETQLLEKISAARPELTIIDSAAGIARRRLSAEEEAAEEREHAEEPGPAREEAGAAEELDPHVWLSPRRAPQIVRNLAAGLAALDPAHADEYARNRDQLVAELEALDRRLAAALAPLKGRTFYVFHPAYGYFADDYGLVQRAVEVEGKDPGPRQLAELIAQARAEGVRVIFVQPQFAPLGARAVAEAIGGAVVPLDPLARDYLPNLERLAEALERALIPAAGEARP